MLKKEKMVLIVLILTLLISVASSTYAYLYFSTSNNNTLKGNMATAKLTLNVNKVFPLSTSTNTNAIVPQLETALSNALKAGCVDSNTNVVCQVYQVKLQNSGTTTVHVNGIFTFYSNSARTGSITTTMPNLRWKKITSIDTTTTSNSILGTNETIVADSNEENESNFFASDEIINVSEEKNYYLIVWLNETITIAQSEGGKSFYGKVTFNSSNGFGVTSTFES